MQKEKLNKKLIVLNKLFCIPIYKHTNKEIKAGAAQFALALTITASKKTINIIQ